MKRSRDWNFKNRTSLKEKQTKTSISSILNYAAEKSNLETVKSDLEEGEELLVERRKHILLADKSEHG